MTTTKKDIRFSTEARTELAKGINILADAVKSTLGPKGRNVIIQKEYGQPTITKDGVSVAKAVNLPNNFQDIGAQIIKEVASKTVEAAGDGTTTATVLAQEILNEGMKAIAAGMNPMDVKRGIDAAATAMAIELKASAKPIATTDTLKIATISANSDTVVGKMVADAIDAVTKDGVITVEEARGVETTLEFVKGMQLDKGYTSPYFVTNQDKSLVELDSPLVLITEKPLDSLKQIEPVLEYAVKQNKTLLIIADRMDNQVLTGLVINKLRGALRSCAISAPAFGDHRKQILQDIAILANTQVVCDETGFNFEKLNSNPAQLGTIGNAIISQEKTTLVGATGDKQKIEDRIATIRTQIEATTSDYEKEKLQGRLAKLVGGVAVIKVGGSSELEVKEKKDRFDDAISATKAAIEEGVVPGGGVALLRATSVLDAVEYANSDQKAGIEIIRKAASAPIRTIASNAGVSGDSILSDLKKSTNKNEGYNAATGVFVDMLEAGIIDPVKVVRSALQNAASVAGLTITTEVVIGIIPKKDEPETEQMM